MPRSLKSHLAVSILIGLGGLLAVAAFVFHRAAEQWLVEPFDEVLEAKARALVTLTKEQDGHVELDFADELMPEFEVSIEPEYFEVWLGAEKLLERSHSLAGVDLPRRAPRSFAGAASPPRFFDHRLPDGRSGRSIQIDFRPQVVGGHGERTEPSGSPSPATQPATSVVSLVVARSRQALDHQLAVLERSILLGGLGLAAAAAFLVWLALGRGLEPLEDIRRQIDGLDERHLDRRIYLDKPRTELEPVVRQLNLLLQHLQSAFERERRLSGHLAHELRTPIAELRSLTEVGSLWPDDPEAAKTFYTFAGGIAFQMERIVAHLLALARFDGGSEGVELEHVDVGALVARVWRPLASQALERGLSLRTDIEEGSTITTDLVKLEMILSNLLLNAVTYAPDGSWIRCRLQREGSRFTLTVENAASHLEAADMGLLFDRFWRKDSTRDSGRHVGLGLALVQAFAQLLKLEVGAVLDGDGILAITLQGDALAPS